MWTRPWKYIEGIAVGGGLVVIGMLMQLAFGHIDWDFFAWPVNMASLVLFLSLIILAHLLRDGVYVFRWLSSIPSSVTSIGWASALTVVMGLIRQRSSVEAPAGFPGFDQMLGNWSFVLVWVWMTISLGLTILRVCIPLKANRLPFLLNHLGLFVALTCAVLGSADLRRLKMVARTGEPEWRASDAAGRTHDLPIAIELKSFDMDLYPPKIMLVDNMTGRFLREKAPQNLLLEEGVRSGVLSDWTLEVEDVCLESVPSLTSDSVSYRPSMSPGSCAAALVRATRDGADAVEGWVSCGSQAFSAKMLKLDDRVSAVMPPREPRRYVSKVNIYSKGGCSADSVQVNKPCRVDGWKIYQYNYDHDKGRWSGYSVFEIIRDPWLPAVYVGILMMMAGAVCMFIQFGTAKKENLR